jgi:hypothetical protein
LSRVLVLVAAGPQVDTVTMGSAERTTALF